MGLTDWFLSTSERGNPSTVLDRRHVDGSSWSSGNDVRPLVHGATYFPELVRCTRLMQRGDLLMFTDWRGDPDEMLDGPGTEVEQVFADAARRGVVVKGLVWRSHLDRFAFSEQQNRQLGQAIEAAGGECLLDVAFVGGIDLCHSRNDGPEHLGDPQPQPMAAVYGPTPPWHDAQLAVRGPAVADVETVFRERWDDPSPLTRNPVDRLSEALRRTDRSAGQLPARTADPGPVATMHVQLLRTYPARRHGYPFAPAGERSVARAYDKVVRRAHSLIYVEDQYFWAADIVRCFADALNADENLHLIAVIPHHPDQDGRLSLPPNLIGRQQAIDLLRAAGGPRAAVYGIENHAGTPVYVHAKVCIVDDVWASVGSDNVNRRSWTHDSELSCAVVDEQLDGREPRVLDRSGDGARTFARELRLQLAREHLDRRAGDEADLLDPAAAFGAFAESAARLQDWHDRGRAGVRPPGRLRPYAAPAMTRATRLWAQPLYQTVYDPDGRAARLRGTREF